MTGAVQHITPPEPLRLVVLISGSGSNLQAIIDAISAGKLNARIVAVLSNRPDAYGLQRAQQHAIATCVVDHTAYPDRATFDEALRTQIDSLAPDWVILAGYMRILSQHFVDHFKHRMLNIHPSLLPRHKGLNTHQRALAAGDREHGCSVHLVTPKLDDGAILGQRRVSISATDTVQGLADKVQREEHVLYPQCLQLIAEQRLVIDNTGRPSLDGKTLPERGLDLTNTSLANPT